MIHTFRSLNRNRIKGLILDEEEEYLLFFRFEIYFKISLFRSRVGIRLERVLRRICGNKRDEVTKGWRK
jgi:hypothetical protein